jgi:hypothetical protein
MALLMDTPYLEQLKLSSARLQDMIPATSPFATYTMGSETAPPTIQGIPQNYFDPVTGQFMMPDLKLQPGESIPIIGGNMPPSFGTYTPAPFGESPVAINREIPAVMTNSMTGGGGQERDLFGTQSGLERIGGMNLKINPVSGKIEVLDPNSLASNLLTDYSAIQKFTPAGMISGLLGQSDYGSQLDRIRSQYGDAVADEIQTTYERMQKFGDTPSGLLAGGLKPGTKVKVGNTPGFINSQGNFQAGTPIGEISTNDSAGEEGTGRPGAGTTVGKQTTSQRRNNTGSRGPGGAGGRGPSTRSGRGQDRSGRGQAGGARGGDNPGNTGGTSRF